MEEIVVANLKRLMVHNKHLTPTEAARHVGISQQQMDRILGGQKPRVDTLEKIARGYDLEPYQLMIPGLDPANPQVLRLLSAAEQRLYEALEDARTAKK